MVSSRYEPVPLFVGFISDSAMTASYVPAGIASKDSSGCTSAALKLSCAMTYLTFLLL